MMKKLLCVVLAAAVLLSLGTALAADRLEAVKSAGKLVVATAPDYAPYEFLDKEGNPVGSDISLAKYIAQQLGVELEIEQSDFPTVLGNIAAGKADLGISGMVPKEERKAVMDFTDVYYDDGDQVIVILKKNADTLKTLEDFAGKTVAAQNGTLQQTLVTEQLPDTTCEPVTKVPDAIMNVLSGKVEGVALASVVATRYVANYPDLAICESKFEYTSLGVAAAVPKDSPELLAAINAILKDVIDNGLYLQWMDEAQQLSTELNK